MALTVSLVLEDSIAEGLGIAVGDRLPVVFDRYPDTVYEGTVTSISAQGVVRQNASYYTVKLDVDAPGLLLGMSATVYLPR